MVNDPLPHEDDGDNEQARSIGLAAGLGFSVVISIIVFVGVGVFLDQRYDKAPIFTLTGVAIGLIAAGYQLYELTQIGRDGQGGGPVARTIARATQVRKNKQAR